MILIAFIALLGWPLVAAYLFSKLPFERAIIWSVVSAYLFLPAAFGIDLPGVPAMDKVSLPALCLLLLVMLKAPKTARFKILPQHLVGKALVLLLIVGTVGTALSNTDPFVIGGTYLQGMSLYDALSDTVRAILLVAPFLVGWQYLCNTEGHEDILRILVSVGLFYSVLMLIEIRLSPQLHTWIYGFFPHNFGQQMRGGGFRPVVFLGHGLLVAFFAMTVMVAAAALWQQHKAAKAATAKKYFYLTGYFAVLLVLCKSLGSLLFGLFLLPLVLLLKPRTQVSIAAMLAVISMSYPLLRSADLIPIDSILEAATSYSAERAQSLGVRLSNEDALLARANERPLFGWGGWKRWRIFDPDTGEDTTISDGFWVIVISVNGWAGYIAYFGLLGAPILLTWWRLYRQEVADVTPATSALCLLVSINMIEILPNSTLPPWTWLIAGALLSPTFKHEPETKPYVQRTVL